MKYSIYTRESVCKMPMIMCSWKKLIRFVGNERTAEGSGREVEERSARFRGAVWDATRRKTRRRRTRCGTSRKREKGARRHHDNSRKQVFEPDSGPQPPPAPPAEMLVSTSGFGRLGEGARKKQRILCRRPSWRSASSRQRPVLFSPVRSFRDVFSCVGAASSRREKLFPDIASWQSPSPSF